MKKGLYLQIISIFLLAFIVGIWGCEKEMSAPVINSGEQELTIDDYFPLSVGQSCKIVTTNSGYEPSLIIREQFECGEGIVQEDQSVYQWIRTNLSQSSIIDTSYFYQTETALYFYETADSDPEKILEEPLEVGQTWYRFESSLAESDNLLVHMLDSITTKYIAEGEVIEETKDDLPDTGGLTAGKIYPTVGSGLMTIIAIEDVQLSDGRLFKDCIKIHNLSGDYDNYYWYAKNYGLVKYVIGATDENLIAANTPDGLIIGEYDTSENFFDF